MNAFEGASMVEARGMAVLLPYIEEKAYQGRLVRTCKGPLARFLQEEVGDVIVNTAEEKVMAAEIKIEQRHTGNLFLEVWSNRNLDDPCAHACLGSNPGWLFKLRADLLLYYFLDSDDLYSIPVFKLKRWAFGSRTSKPNLYRDEFREVSQARYGQKNETVGRIVPISALKAEVGLKHTKVRQLALLGREFPL